MPTHIELREGVLGTTGPGKELRTGVWHQDQTFGLPFPVEWQVTILWPPTPPAWSDAQIVDCLNHPAGQPRVSELARGKTRPLIVIDDMFEATPVAQLLPHLVRQFQEAGLPPRSLRVLVANGWYGPPRPESLLKKLGPAALDCSLLIHDPRHGLAPLGELSAQTPVLVNREVIDSDFVVGISGVRLGEAANFAGNPRFTLGLLGLDTLHDLHRRFPEAIETREGGGVEFQRIMDEIDARIGIRTMLTAHTNAERKLVRLACGDPRLYYPQEIEFARTVYSAPPPGDADVVISNAYPSDLSLASVEINALAPLRRAAAGASRIVLASCAEGLGAREFLPPGDSSPARGWRKPLRWLKDFVGGRLSSQAGHRHLIWLFRPGAYAEDLPSRQGDIRLAASWQQIVDAVGLEQRNKTFLRVYLYPCAPLQYLTPSLP